MHLKEAYLGLLRPIKAMTCDNATNVFLTALLLNNWRKNKSSRALTVLRVKKQILNWMTLKVAFWAHCAHWSGGPINSISGHIRTNFSSIICQISTPTWKWGVWKFIKNSQSQELKFQILELTPVKNCYELT